MAFKWVLLVSTDNFWPPGPSGVSIEWVNVLDNKRDGVLFFGFSPPRLDIIRCIKPRRLIHLRVSSTTDLGVNFWTFPQIYRHTCKWPPWPPVSRYNSGMVSRDCISTCQSINIDKVPIKINMFDSFTPRVVKSPMCERTIENSLLPRPASQAWNRDALPSERSGASLGISRPSGGIHLIAAKLILIAWEMVWDEVVLEPSLQHNETCPGCASRFSHYDTRSNN